VFVSEHTERCVEVVRHGRHAYERSDGQATTFTFFGEFFAE
jgi:hypothetical protein